MRIQLAHHTLKGSRPTNQDRVAYAERDGAILMVLADGLGGYDGGALAAETLTQSIVRAFESVRQPVIDKPSAFLALAIMQAHKLIIKNGRASIPPISPRTTCVVCMVQRGYAYWAHVGDSRLYHFRGAKLLQRTLDHSTTEQMHLDGLLSEDEMRLHPEKGHLLKCVGGPQKPIISLGEETVLGQGDTLLLCSDGLWQAMNPAEIARFMGFRSLDEGVEEMLLVAERKMKKNCDNLSAMGLRWEDRPTAAPPLQPVRVAETSHEAMMTAVFRNRAGHRRRPENTGPPTHSRVETLDAAIKELEDFVSRFDPKRGKDR